MCVHVVVVWTKQNEGWPDHRRLPAGRQAREPCNALIRSIKQDRLDQTRGCNIIEQACDIALVSLVSSGKALSSSPIKG